MSEVQSLIHSVERSRDRLLRVVSPLSPAQAAFRTRDGEWSILEIVEHLYLAELSGVAKIWAALNGLRVGRRWIDARPHHGESIERIVDRTWQPKEQAPPIATPHIGGPLPFWLTATHSLTPVLSSLGAALDGTNLEDIVFPHFLSGPLDGRQRLEFLRFHIDRHLMQIERTKAASAFPN